MWRNILKYLIILIIFIILDYIWLGLIAKNIYKEGLGFLMRVSPNKIATALLYLILVFGLMIFVISPALNKSNITHAIIYGALFGFVCYATYDLTNLATIRSWPLHITLIDITAGTVICSLVSTLSCLLISRIW